MNMIRKLLLSVALVQVGLMRAETTEDGKPQALISEAELPEASMGSGKPHGEAERELTIRGGWRSSWSRSTWKSSSTKKSWKKSTDHPTLFPTSNPTVNPTMSPTMDPTMSPTMNPTLNPTLAPTMSPTASPTFCGKASKSWYYDDDYTSSGSSSESSESSGSSGKSGKSEDCNEGPRPSGKSGKSGSSSSSSSDDRRRLHSSDMAAGKVRPGDRILSAQEELSVRRRKIHVRD